MSKPWKKKSKRAAEGTWRDRKAVERQLAHLEKTAGVELVCFKKGCTKKAIGMDECLTCEKLGKAHRVLSCEIHRGAGLAAVKKHSLVKHPANLLRVVAAGLKGEQI